MRKNPYLRTSTLAGAIVVFDTWRPEYRAVAKRAASAYLLGVFGAKAAKRIERQGYFAVDSLADAMICKHEMEAYRDSTVSQFVFNTSVFVPPPGV